MLTVETIKKVRLSLARGESLRSVAGKYSLSRNTVRNIARSGATEHKYAKSEVRYPVLGPYTGALEEMLKEECGLPQNQRCTAMRIFERLREKGYGGSYPALRRYIRAWEGENSTGQSAFVPLSYGKSEAFQFDWSEETAEIGGEVQKVQVAQVRLCYSRLRFCMAFMRQEMAMVIEAHIQAHDFFGGLCGKGIYDNPKTIVGMILRGKERKYNQRFLQLASHYLFEPVACTPGAGWEKGQVENQVSVNRRRIFTPRLKFQSMSELNAHLRERMLFDARENPHPEFREKRVWDVYEEERPYLRRQDVPFPGYTSDERRADSQCMVRFDSNHYSVPCEYAGKHVTVRVFAYRLILASDGCPIAEHKRAFGKGQYILDPMHYLPLLKRKPGALRNGRPFPEWELPSPVRAVWESLRRYPDWDRQMARILSAIPVYGAEAVSVACEMAIEEKAVSQNVVLNYLTRLTEEPEGKPMPVSKVLKLKEEPRSDCSVYDSLLENARCCANIS